MPKIHNLFDDAMNNENDYADKQTKQKACCNRDKNSDVFVLKKYIAGQFFYMWKICLQKPHYNTYDDKQKSDDNKNFPQHFHFPLQYRCM